MVHGKFHYYLQLQSHSKTVSIVPVERRGDILLSHYWQGGESERCGVKIPLSKRSICSNLEGRGEISSLLMSLTISKAASLCWNSPLAFIQTETKKKERGYALKGARASRVQAAGAVLGRLGSLKKPLLQFWQWRPSVLWRQSSHTPPLRRPPASHNPRLKWQLSA